LLAFSIERSSGKDYQLLSSGRFAHNPAYVQSLLLTDFVELHSEPTTVRLEALHPVPGDIFLFRKRPAGK
jgi:predicted TPR repeat methyltransferase